MTNEKIITTTIARISLKRVKEWVVVITSKNSAPNKLLGLFKPRIWFELVDSQEAKMSNKNKQWLLVCEQADKLGNRLLSNF